MTGEVVAGWLALTLQAFPTAPKIPVAIYPVLDHGADPLAADRLTRALGAAFRRDSGLAIIDRGPAAKPATTRAVYGVLADLHPAAGGSVRLLIRVVDIQSVYLVGFDSATGSRADVERALPALAGKAAQRLKTLRTIPRSGGHPPSWQIPTEALQAYSRALLLVDRGDTAGAVRLLSEALRIFPQYGEACQALHRFLVNPSCTVVR